MCKFSNFHPKRGILGYNAYGKLLLADETDTELTHWDFTLLSDEVIKEVKYLKR